MRSPTPAFTMMPLVPETSTPPSPAPSPQSSVMALVIVTAPNPPGSRQSISPPVAVLEIAPAKVLHGAVRLQGLASSPTPEIQVRVAWAWAGADASMGVKKPRNIASVAIRRIGLPPLLCADFFQPVLSRDRQLDCTSVPGGSGFNRLVRNVQPCPKTI